VARETSYDTKRVRKMPMNINTILTASGETMQDLRMSGNSFTWEELLSLMSHMVGGKAFDLSQLQKHMKNEIRMGSLYVDQRNESLIFRFEPKHPINKYPELRKRSLTNKINSGEIKPTGHSGVREDREKSGFF
jgi:hypothetical protein